MRRGLRSVGVWLCGGLLAFAAAAPAPAVSAPSPQPGAGGCRLGSPAGGVQHVIYLQFDNIHFGRDNLNVPSDLEQMPHLLNFLTANGTLLTQQHTPLIAHTGGDIVTIETGLYPDRHGLAISNTYRYFTPAGPARTGVAFTYWTDPVFDPGQANPTDTSFNMVGPDGRNAPAPCASHERVVQIDAALDDLAARRDDVAGRMLARLEGAAFGGMRLDAVKVAGLQAEADALLNSARSLTVGK